MVTTINPRSVKKKSAGTLGTRSNDNIDQKINSDEYVIEGHVAKVPSESKEVLEMSDDDPGLIQWMLEQEEKWKQKHPNLTREEMDQKIDKILESEKELRKKSPY